MGVASLTQATLIVPRSELAEAAKGLSEFEWFHTIAPESRNLDPVLDSLTQRAFKVYVDLDELVRELEIQIEPGIIDMLARGYNVEKEKYSAKDWEDLVGKVEVEGQPFLDEGRQLLEESAKIRKALSDDRALLSALQLIAGFSVDLDILTKLKRVHIVFTVVSQKDLKEIRKSLAEAIVVETPLTKTQSAALISTAKADAARVEKVLRSFEVKPFIIPQGLPQNPAEAYEIIERRESESREKETMTSDSVRLFVKRIRERLLILREAAQTANKVMDKIRRSGDLKRFAIIKGYIPSSHRNLFDEKFSHYISFAEPVKHTNHESDRRKPTLSTNRRINGAFENITLNQGLPHYGEVDPTPLISLIFPIFFGIMFADLGHGLVLFAFSAFLYTRGSPGIKRWATIFMVSGISASVAGILIGEFFGLGIKKLIPFLGSLEVLEVVEHTHNQLSLEAISSLLVFSWVIGIIHIGLGLGVNVYKGVKESETLELIIEKIPLFLLYIFSVIFGLSFVGAGLTFANMLSSTDPLPLLPFLNTTQGTIVSLAGALPLIGILMFGKAVAIKMGKVEGEEFGEAIMINPIETLFEKLPGFLANTISYARLGILLVVHAALLIATNGAWALGPAGYPIIFIANILIIILEGMIVYIQTLRLHLYEWFTKFYDGSGEAFKKMTPEALRVKLDWDRSS